MRQEEQETQSSTSRHSKMNLQSGKYFNEASTQLQIHEKKILKNEDQIQENTNKVLNVSCEVPLCVLRCKSNLGLSLTLSMQ